MAHIVSLDFGSAFIRLALGVCGPLSLIGEPQMIEFGGQRGLRNVLYLSEDGQTAIEVGDDVFISERAYENPANVRQGLALLGATNGAGPSPERLLLQHMDAALRYACSLPPDQCRSVFAVPLETPPATCQALCDALRGAGFPAPEAYVGVRAALAWQTRHKPDLPVGPYLVLDCGVAAMRATVCYRSKLASGCPSPGGWELQPAVAGPPGGRDFDALFTALLRERSPQAVPTSVADELEFLHFAASFKEDFSRRWAEGASSYEAWCPIPAICSSFDLAVVDFCADSRTQSLLGAFGTTVADALAAARLNPQDLSGIVLCGGGANWPFVQQWCQNHAAGIPLFVDKAPEESVVCGLALLASAAVPTAETERKTGIPPVKESEDKRRKPKGGNISKRPLNPTAAFWVEFLPGLFGFLGLGRILYLSPIAPGCLILASWSLLSLLALVALIGLAISQEKWWLALIWLPLWIGVPLLSALHVRYQVLQRRCKAQAAADPLLADSGPSRTGRLG